MDKVNEVEILRKAREIVEPFGIHAEIHNDLFSVGVKGNGRNFATIIELSGKHPGFETLVDLIGKLNTLPINRVTIQGLK